MIVVLSRDARGVVATTQSDDGTELATESVDDLVGFVVRLEAEHPRWVWDDTARWYPLLLAGGIRVRRCVDLRLCHAILARSELTRHLQPAAEPWTARAPSADRSAGRPEASDALFDIEPSVDSSDSAPVDPVAEFGRQRTLVAACAEPGRLARLLAAESTGALIAAELTFAGLPWSESEHDAILTRRLGPRPRADERPERLAALLETLRMQLDAADLNPDSPTALLPALARAGIAATSTRAGELTKFAHPAIPTLLAYKDLARLWAANGWHWLDTWVADGRFRPEYTPGGVVTGRWATSGGGALQLPHVVRGAVVADPGWLLVVADAAQLEPRILAALAGDRAMLAAGASGDLYAGIVASGAVRTREEAKVSMLGAMYGATGGRSGALLPRLAHAYPDAMGLVESAARAGERGEQVSTRLGRSSPPGPHALGYDESTTAADAARARERARSWGRFTRNFVVQGTAAEWALCWMAGIRERLGTEDATFRREAHLVFFLHDEVVVHAPADSAAGVERHIRDAAAEAGRRVFGDVPAAFPVTVARVRDYGQAK